MEWIADPTVWVGLLTLVLLEIVLGIDNLVVIAILAGKLPPQQRDRARLIGLSLALLMRPELVLIRNSDQRSGASRTSALASRRLIDALARLPTK